jgi:DNA modification methylase
MLTWVGKRPLRHVVAFPSQHVETFDPTEESTKQPGGLLFHGDNKEVLAHLLANGFRGKVDVVYIDPPFDSGADYVRKVALRGPKGSAKVDGETYTLGEQLQYTDIWANDNYLQFMFERLLLLKELLAEDGSIFVHCDWHKHHYLRCVLDEVFGSEAFRNEIVVKRGRRKNLQSQFDSIEALGAETDVILLYARGGAAEFSKVESAIRATTSKWKDFWRGNVDRRTMRYAIDVLAFPEPKSGQLLWKRERGIRAADNYKTFLESGEPDLENYWLRHAKRYKDETGHKLEFVHWDEKHNIKYWIPSKDVGVIGSLWADIEAYSYRHDFRTEKHEALLERILTMASGEDDLVLDCFIGSGTTAAVAQKLGRRWIGCDINKGAIQMTGKRLQQIMGEQITAAKEPKQQRLEGTEADDEVSEPAQLSFSVHRVNDYDLAIHHVEAVNLACEHIGVIRMRTDRYFDGTLGKRLVKVVPFNHPLTLLDFEELKRELEARPEEDRDVVLVCLGKEPAADAWIADWNRLRKGASTPNRVEVIELRTDPKYGKFFQHQPARAKVRLVRGKPDDAIEIEDFVSPTIIERLREQAGILQPKIDDWRAMVDCVLIDPEYDGQIFKIAVSDVPQRKTDLVAGRYTIPKGQGTVAVKLIDMLGEEVLVTLAR